MLLVFQAQAFLAAAENHLHEFSNYPHYMPINIQNTLLRRVMPLFVVKLDKLYFNLLFFLRNSETFRLIFPFFHLFDINLITKQVFDLT